MNQEKTLTKKPFKYNWDHQLWIHRVLVKSANSILRFIPFNVKYSLGKMFKKKLIPYSLISDDFTILQIGAPTDTLNSGRSRGMYFALFNKDKTGKTIIIEPAQSSERSFNEVKKKYDLKNFHFIQSGAWNKKEILRFYFDPSHPATNFAEGTVNYSEERLKDFQLDEIHSDTVDSLLDKIGIHKVDMVSITTNGSERQIVEGMKRTISKGVKYIALAGGQEEEFELMKEYGYKFISYDDRGATFIKNTAK